MKLFGLIVMLTFISSCGKSNSSAGMPIEKQPLPVNGSNIEGLYMADLNTLNDQVNSLVQGSATLQRRDDKFFAYVRLSGGGAKVWHQQNIHEGGRCPDLSDDLNGDGIIDNEEGSKVWGKVLIPLDSDLSSQLAGKNVYPIGDSTGNYFYERAASFEEMFTDLKTEDTNLTDSWMKLPADSGLDFTNKVVVIHGAPADTTFPDTVTVAPGQNVHHGLPIACGVFAQVTSVPGEPLPTETPGPMDTPTTTDDGSVSPTPEPSPEPSRPTPEPGSPGDVEDHDEDEQEPTPPRAPRSPDDEEGPRWYDRIIDWWRTTWVRERGNSRHRWGRGGWDFF